MHGFLTAIKKCDIKKGDLLLSVNNAMREFTIAREMVFKAYKDLKSSGIVQSKKGVGYFLICESVNQSLKVMMLIRELDPYQEVFYNAMCNTIKCENFSIDIFLHNGNPQVFRSILKDNIGKYARCIITPFDHKLVKAGIKQIDKNKL